MRWLVTMALGRCLNSSILPVRDGTHSSPARERERCNHKDLLPPSFEVTMLPSALFPLDSTRNRVTKNKSRMPRGVQNEERIKLLEQWEAATLWWCRVCVCFRTLQNRPRDKSSQGVRIQSSSSFFVAPKKGRGELMVWDPEKATLATRTNPKLSCVELKATQTRTIATLWRGQSSAVSKRPPCETGQRQQRDRKTSKRVQGLRGEWWESGNERVTNKGNANRPTGCLGDV